MTDFDRQLLSVLQRRMPLVPRPYAALAEELGSDEPTVLDRVSALRGGDEPVIREIAAVLEASALGYASALVACRVATEKLRSAGACIASHPGVSHCYAREGWLNLWYTLTLGDDSRLGVARSAELLGRLAGAERTNVLPTLRRYKISVHIGADGESDSTGGQEAPPPPRALSELERSAIAALQTDLPAGEDPFAELAARAGLSRAELLQAGEGLLRERIMRRYAAVLHHRRAGLQANLLAVWRVSEAGADAAGKAAAAEPAVSHCYLRPTAGDWPYNLYTMIHGRTKEDCALVADEIAATTGLSDHVKLWTVEEFKKAKVRYFTGLVGQWEEEHPPEA